MSAQASSLSSIHVQRSSSSSSSSVSVSIKTTTSVGTSTSCVAARAARRGRDGSKILGTAIIWSDTTESTCLHLRLGYSKRGHHGSDVGKLLHGVSLYPLLRPRQLCQAGRPPPAGLFFVQTEEHPLGRRSLPVLVRVVHLALLLPGPGLPLSS